MSKDSFTNSTTYCIASHSPGYKINILPISIFAFRQSNHGICIAEEMLVEQFFTFWS